MVLNFFSRNLCGALVCALFAAGLPALAAAPEFVLSENCPPGFELSSGQCKLRSMYQM